MFLELTGLDYEKIYLNPNAIESFFAFYCNDKRCTKIIVNGGSKTAYLVLESVNEVLRLIEKAARNG